MRSIKELLHKRIFSQINLQVTKFQGKHSNCKADGETKDSEMSLNQGVSRRLLFFLYTLTLLSTEPRKTYKNFSSPQLETKIASSFEEILLRGETQTSKKKQQTDHGTKHQAETLNSAQVPSDDLR